MAIKHEKIYTECMNRAANANAAFARSKPHLRHGHSPILEIMEWIHLADAVESGTISPMEAYETFELGYVAQHLRVRESRYSHSL